MREKVKKELEYIPDFPNPQKDLRMIYWSQRMHSLGAKAETKKSAKEVLQECIEYLKENGGSYYKKDSGYEFLYNEEFFRVKEK